MSRLFAQLWLLVLVCMSCGSDSTIDETYTLVSIEPSSEVQQSARYLRVSATNLSTSELRFTRELSLHGDAQDWPVALRLRPENNELPRFALEVVALNSERQEVSRARLVSGFIAKQHRYARVLLAACTCEPSTRTCVLDEVEPSSLSTRRAAADLLMAHCQPGPNIRDSGTDASMHEDGGGPDGGGHAMQPDGGGPDGGGPPLRPDAGPDSGASPQAPFQLVSRVPSSSTLDDPRATISVTLSAAVDPKTVNESSFVVTRDGRELPGSRNVLGEKIEFKIAPAWVLSASYGVSLRKSIKDRAGRALVAGSFEFEVRPGKWSATSVAVPPSGGVFGSPMVVLTRAGKGLLAWSRTNQRYASNEVSWLQPDSAWGAPTSLGEGYRHNLLINEQGHALIAHGNGPDPTTILKCYIDSWTMVSLATPGTPRTAASLFLTDNDSLTVLGTSYAMPGSLYIADGQLGQELSSGQIVESVSSADIAAALTPFSTWGWAAAWRRSADADAGLAAAVRASCSSCTPQTLSATGAQVGAPVIASDPGARSAVALWIQTQQSWPTLWAARLVSGSNAWTSASQVSDGRSAASDARLVLNVRGEATAVWLQSDGSAIRVMTASLDTGSGAWSAPTALSQADSVASAPLIASESQGNLIALWLQRRLDDTRSYGEVRWARYLSRGEWISETTALSTPAVDVPELSLAMDDLGRASAAWVEAGSIWAGRYE